MATLAEIRAKLQAASQQSTGGGGGDKTIFPHWNIPEGSTTSVRFLPDGDTSNTYFWQERQVIKLPFAGVKGDTASKPVVVQVPCMEMYNKTCPILTEARAWFATKDPALEAMGKKYWKKRSYIFQGFVVGTDLKEEGLGENPIRRFVINKQIYDTIKAALMDPEFSELPTDYVRGTDFKITKTSKGQYADYATSTWARRERALDENELAAIEQYKLFNLKDFLPKEPGEVELKVIEEMFAASVDGEAFDMERWGQYYKPSGYKSQAATGTGTSTPAASDDHDEEDNIPTPTVKSTPAPKAESASAEGTNGSRAQDILAMIRNRQKSE